VKDGEPCRCDIEDGAMACLTGGGRYGVEGDVPRRPDPPGVQDARDARSSTARLRRNSGVYLHGKWEIQILDSYQNPTYADGVVGACTDRLAPLVNPARRRNSGRATTSCSTRRAATPGAT